MKPDDDVEQQQLEPADLDGMTSREITQAVLAGRCDRILGRPVRPADRQGRDGR